MGKRELIKHTEIQSHKDQTKTFQSQARLQFSTPSLNETQQRMIAELKMAVLTASNNIPLAFHDKLSPTIRSVFPDSKVASNYHSASTKMICLLNLAVAPLLMEELVESMKTQPFSLSTDGSNDITDLNLILDGTL